MIDDERDELEPDEPDDDEDLDDDDASEPLVTIEIVALVVDHWRRTVAAASVRASTVGATSCTRKTRAPRS